MTALFPQTMARITEYTSVARLSKWGSASSLPFYVLAALGCMCQEQWPWVWVATGLCLPLPVESS